MHRPIGLLLCLLALPLSAATFTVTSLNDSGTGTTTTADLSITKTADTAKASARSRFTYTITVTNSGPDAATAVTMTDVLPPQLRFLSQVITTTGSAEVSCVTPGFFTNGTITCSASQMAAGATVTLMLQVIVAPDGASGTVTNTATVTSPTADPDTADRSATAPGVELVPGADLAIRMITNATSARPDAFFHYTMFVQNTGPDAATDVVVTDVLPPDLLFEAIAPGPFTCTTPAAGTNGTVTCTAATLPPPIGNGFSILVRVAPGARPGVVTNHATISSSTLELDHDDMTAAAPPVTIATPLGVERRLDLGASAPPWTAQMAPQVATTEQNALAVWAEGYVSFAPPGAAASIRGALFRPDAEGQTMIDFAAPQFGADFAFPFVAAAGDRYLVVWREVKSGQGRIMARRVGLDGSFLDAAPLVLETAPTVRCCNNVGDPRPAVASNGRDFYVTWVSSNYDVRGIVVLATGPVTWEAEIISREADTRSRGRYDLEIVWTSGMYVVAWLDRVFQLAPPSQHSTGEPFVLRYARVTPGGNLLDTQLTNSIAGPFNSMTATPLSDGAVLTIDYVQSDQIQGPLQCVGILLLTSHGDPADSRSLRCEPPPGPPSPELHSTLVPVSNGFLLVQPGRPDQPSFQDFPLRTSTADPALTQLSAPTLLGPVAREVSVASWRGAPLLVYNRTDGDDPATRVGRVFSFLIQGRRTRAVRH